MKTTPRKKTTSIRIRPEDAKRFHTAFSKSDVGKFFTLETTDHLDRFRIYPESAIRQELKFHAGC